MDVFDFLEKLEDKSVDLAIVDPPYNKSIDKWDEFKDEEEFLEFTFNWIQKTISKIKPNGSFYVFNSPYNCAIVLNYLRDKNVFFKNWITWYKKDGFGPTKKRYVNNQESILFFTMSNSDYTFNADEIRVPYDSKSRMKHAEKKGILKNGKRWFPNEKGKLCTDVWEESSYRHKNKKNGKTQKFIHPTPKPLEIIKRMILASSNENDLILDLFSGSGTTSYISKKYNRNFLGCEVNKEYFKYANERLKSIKRGVNND